MVAKNRLRRMSQAIFCKLLRVRGLAFLAHCMFFYLIFAP